MEEGLTYLNIPAAECRISCCNWCHQTVSPWSMVKILSRGRGPFLGSIYLGNVYFICFMSPPWRE